MNNEDTSWEQPFLFVISWIVGIPILIVSGRHLDFGSGLYENSSSLILFGVGILLILLPFYRSVKIPKILELERNVQETKSEVSDFKQQVNNSLSSMAATFSTISFNQNRNIMNFVFGEAQGRIEPPQAVVRPRQPMEYKILNTLWTKQVNKWPDLSHFFSFRINFYTQEFLAFREAGNKLMGEGLIGESDTGQFYLTPEGFNYCKGHYKEFPPHQWWPEETINPENLRNVVPE